MSIQVFPISHQNRIGCPIQPSKRTLQRVESDRCLSHLGSSSASCRIEGGERLAASATVRPGQHQWIAIVGCPLKRKRNTCVMMMEILYHLLFMIHAAVETQYCNIHRLRILGTSGNHTTTLADYGHRREITPVLTVHLSCLVFSLPSTVINKSVVSTSMSACNMYAIGALPGPYPSKTTQHDHLDLWCFM